MFCYVKYDHCAAREEVHNKTCPGQSLIQYHVPTIGFGGRTTRADCGKRTIALNTKQLLNSYK